MRRTEHRIHKYHGIIPSACMFPMSMSPCVCVRTVCYAACVKNVYVNRDAVRVNMWIVNEHNERSRGDAHTPTGTKPYVRTYVRSPEKSQRKSNTQLNVVNKPNNGILLPTHAPGQSLYIFAFVCVNVCECVSACRTRWVLFSVFSLWKRWNAVSVTNTVCGERNGCGTREI